MNLSPEHNDWPSDDTWPPETCPPLALPALGDTDARLSWYHDILEVYAQLWGDGRSASPLCPVPMASLHALETRLGSPLPKTLFEYHQKLGTLALPEQLCSIEESSTCIQALDKASFLFRERCENDDDWALGEALIVFSENLSNGNLFCFHRNTHAIYYIAPHEPQMISYFSETIDDYLDALFLRALSEIYDNEELGTEILLKQFGADKIEKWLY